jgi:hypothetical protein
MHEMEIGTYVCEWLHYNWIEARGDSDKYKCRSESHRDDIDESLSVEESFYFILGRFPFLEKEK